MAAKGLTDERAARLMTELRDGRTPNSVNVKAPQLETYFATHPDYAREAGPLIEAKRESSSPGADRSGSVTGNGSRRIPGGLNDDELPGL